MEQKRIIAVVLSLCCVICFCGCGGRVKKKFDREAREELKTVQEWADAVGVLEKENWEIYDFSKTPYGVGVSYVVGGPTVYDNFLELQTASNQFMKEHPDYFPEDYEISFYGVSPSRQCYDYVLSNRLMTEQFDVSCIDFDIEETEKVQFFYIEMDITSWEMLKAADCKLEISALFLDYWEGDIMDQETYDISCLDCFEGLEYIVINIQIAEIDDYTILKNRIEEHVPGCEVYILDRGESLVKKDNSLSEKS